ncbi:MAG: TetR/AcrR family transcriptional regulator [Tissierellia bacterium]|nr:TetR/AcrR family transcriptional regulator [Tissierellia bacterium]
MSLINRPKTTRGEKTLQSIIDAAEIVFYEKGYNGSTIKDISNEAGVSVGTIYIYFPDKKSIYDYLLLQYSKYIRANIAKRIEGIKSRKEAERLGLLVFLEIVRESKYIYNIIWESLYIDKQKFIDYYMDFAEHYSKQIKEAMDDGVMLKYDPEVVAWTLMGISNFIGLRYVMFKDNEDLDKVADEVMNMLDRGLFGTEK